MKTEKEIARLSAVQYDTDTDSVYVVFKVMDESYKEMVLRFAKRDDVEMIIRGDKLYATHTDVTPK